MSPATCSCHLFHRELFNFTAGSALNCPQQPTFPHLGHGGGGGQPRFMSRGGVSEGQALSQSFHCHLWRAAAATGLPRPLLPPAFCMAAFTAVHSLAHPGIRATQRLMSSRWLWAGMVTDKSKWCRDCQRCQRAKVTKQRRATVQTIVIPARRFSHLHLDLVGPLPRSAQGYNHILTIVDRSSHWLEAIPLSSTTTAAVADTLWLAGWPDLVFQSTSPLTGGCSSVQRCRCSSHVTSAIFTISLQPTIPRPMEW